MFRLGMLALTAIAVVAASTHLWSENSPAAQASEPATTMPRQTAQLTSGLREMSDAEVLRRMQTRQAFADFSDAVIVELAAGRVTLRQARNQVMYYCLAHYPEYLNHVQTILQGRSVKLNLARCLVRFVREYDNPDMEFELSDEVLTSLHMELHEMCLEEVQESGVTAAF